MKLDNLDYKILYKLDINSKKPVKQIAKELKTKREVIDYRIKKLIKEKIITRFTTLIETQNLDIFSFRTYVNFYNLSVNKEKEIFNSLLKTKNIGWIYKTLGIWDANIIYYSKSLFEFSNFWEEFYNNYGKYIKEKETTILNWYEIYSKEFLINKNQIINREKTINKATTKKQITKKENEILKILSKNSKETIINISKKVNLSTNTVYSKIKDLEKRNIILRYTIGINYELLGYKYYKILLDFKNNNRKEFEKLKEFCEKNPNVWNITNFIGGKDLEIEIYVTSEKQLVSFLDNLRYKFNNLIKEYQTIHYLKDYVFNLYPF